MFLVNSLFDLYHARLKNYIVSYYIQHLHDLCLVRAPKV